MSIIEEDGTGKSTSESYCTVTFADAFHTARGNTPWLTITTAQKEQALRRATEYMLQVYTARWQGTRVLETQALDWPRYNVVVNGYSIDDDVIPETIKRACAEVAIKAAAGALAPDLTQGILSEQVGSISVTYNPNSPQQTRYKAIDAMLSPFLKAGSNNISMGLVRT